MEEKNKKKTLSQSKKESKKNTIIVCISVFVGICVFVLAMYLSGMSLQSTLISLFGLFLLFIAILIVYVIPSIYFDERDKLLNKSYIFDLISIGNKSENIRLTKDGQIFKYEETIKFKYRFPRMLQKYFGYSEEKRVGNGKPGYKISKRKKLTEFEASKLVEEINSLRENEDGQAMLKTKELTRRLNIDEVNNALHKYSRAKLKE